MGGGGGAQKRQRVNVLPTCVLHSRFTLFLSQRERFLDKFWGSL